MMGSNDENCITEEEAELYDRQIRLWGANVQRSLRNTRVLVVGLKGVAGEVCKNLILSGVKSITMMDHEKVSETDLSSNYLLYPDSVDENRAKASLKAAQILNPNVKVSVDTSSPLDKPISFYSNFDVVCVTNQPSSVIICLNDICKLYKIKFFNGESFGMFGYLFEDLNNSKLSETVSASYQTALNFKWTPKTSLKKRKQEDPSYLVFKILTDFKTLRGHNPSRKSENDNKLLTNLRNSVLNKFNMDDSILPSEYLENVYGEYGPTCSIIGGMIAQEIVKSLSKDEFSPSSIYFFNHIRCQMSGLLFDEPITVPSAKNETMELDNQNIVEL